MMLCHDYCVDVASTIYLDSVRAELLNETQMIRRRAYPLPKEAMVHNVYQGEYGEWVWA
jgi:hypothetical protein